MPSISVMKDRSLDALVIFDLTPTPISTSTSTPSQTFTTAGYYKKRRAEWAKVAPPPSLSDDDATPSTAKKATRGMNAALLETPKKSTKASSPNTPGSTPSSSTAGKNKALLSKPKAVRSATRTRSQTSSQQEKHEASKSGRKPS